MLRFVILTIVFFLIFWFVYRKVKCVLMFWNSELFDDGLEDRQRKIKIEEKIFDDDLNQKEKELKKEEKKVKRMKKERTSK